MRGAILAFSLWAALAAGCAPFLERHPTGEERIEALREAIAALEEAQREASDAPR